AWYPTINLSANGLPQSLSGETYSFVPPAFEGADPTITRTIARQQSATFQATAQWKLIDPARVPQIAAARDTFEKARNAYLIALRDARLNSAIQYFSLQKADEGVRIGKQSVGQSIVSLRDAMARFQAGVATKLEVLEAETQLARDKQTLTKYLADQSKGRRELASSLNLPQDITPTAASPARVLGVWQPSLEESIIAAYTFREELDLLILDISINNSNANSSLAAIQPVLSLFDSFTTTKTQGQSGVDASSSNVDWGNYSWSQQNAVGLNVTWNFFDGGRARASYRYNKQ
ncbi:MAG: TolC family protein, partial [bacterium]|nr:TolC family protein [bacterium]